ncbi:MAG: N-acetyltransferase [Candidatus Levybacteria bacterium]|nr:N-acetyltransferase [Candidatus Levybacteria bacterium]
MKTIVLTKADIDRIINFEREHAPESPIYQKYKVSDLMEIFDNPRSSAFGMIEKDELIAWASYRLVNDTFEMSSLVVHKNFRRKGIGKTLLDHAIKKLLEKEEKPFIYLTVYTENRDALILYLKNNFVIYDFKKNYYGEGSHRLFLKYNS